jgi:pSer/pThr/pTyr-binding forkhead associated (FHA) protein
VPVSQLLTIGRSHNNDLVLKTMYASRRHAWVWRQGDQFIIEDLGSMHGTYVNGQRLATPRFLHNHDTVVMGEARLTFVSRPDRHTEQTPPYGVEQPVDSQIFCARCGIANPPQASFCERCGSGLSQSTGRVADWPEDRIHTARPITPIEPVVARPFPTVKSEPKAGARSAWLLILLLAILAVGLLIIAGALVAYVLT